MLLIIHHPSPDSVSEDDLDMVAPKNLSAGSKRKAYEVDFEAYAQEAVENLIRKEIDHVTGIFGISVSTGIASLFISYILITCY